MDLISLVVVLMCSVSYSAGLTCIDVVDIVQQTPDSQLIANRTVIVPRLNFTCNGRITNIRVRIDNPTEIPNYDNTGTNFPYIQVWRQSPTSQLNYSLVNKVQIQSDHLNTQLTYLEAIIPLTGNNRIQFLSGDVIGFYNPPDSGYVTRDIQTPGYVMYVFIGSNASSFNLSTGIMSDGRQPLIQFTLDILCNNLTTPFNGEITSCTSGRIGMGYERDTCSFTCNTGYELIGSDTRTCQSNGSWNGSDVVCRRAGLTCIDVVDNVQQTPDSQTIANRTVIVPRLNFTCNGRITNIRVRIDSATEIPNYDNTGTNFPYIQVWRQSPTSQLNYSLVNKVQIQSDHLNTQLTYLEAIIPLTGNNRIQFLSGDVIGFYNPPDSGYVIRDIQTPGYVFYVFIGSNASSFNLSTGIMSDGRQPLIQFTLDILCNNLTTPFNGEITSCTSGSIGMGYERDTCSFTCNTGYELIGSDTRTCQSNGSWNGSDVVCRRVPCPLLTDPSNGTINCSLGGDGVTSYEDTCSFTCNTGHELTGSHQRTCQSDGSWSGSPVPCTIMECPSSSLPMNSMLAESCSRSYQSMCDLQCEEGFDGSGEPSYVCDVLSNGSSVMWMTSGGGWSCERRSSGSSSGSTGAVIGGIIGGVVVAMVIIVVLVVVIIWVRRSRRKQVDIVDYDKSKNGVDSIATPTAVSDKQGLDVESLLTIALSGINVIYDEVISYENSKGIYQMSSNDVAKSLQTEESIYDTPYSHIGDCGPIYCVPADDEKKIYEEFAGKKFRKLLHKEIKVGEELGSGEFGIVARAMWKPTSRKKVEVAVKTLNENVSTKDRVRFLQEAAIMCQFDHENVVKLHGVVTDEPVMIVLEYVSRGDLRNLLIQLQPSIGTSVHAKLPLLLLKFCQEIAAGMAYLSGKQFVHRDLATRNILVSESVTCKIADFGMSRDLLDENYYVTSGGKIPVKWTAPEAIHFRKYSCQSDVWSYGIVLYEIWSLGREPYEWLNLIESVEKLDTGFRLQPPPGCPRTIYRVMIKCWDPEPLLRPQFGQITKLLAGNHSYLLGWSDEDKKYGGEDAMKLGSRLECANNLYYDLQMKYKGLQ
ncbi:uncharacterized protein [Dysidea avara]|uniref:uncharacterized protein isoform X2 n=1 Tax=Dysidea avara TaxID=196820 RepID=UPI00332E3A89